MNLMKGQCVEDLAELLCNFLPDSYQFPTVNSETTPYALMVRFCCICGAKIVHATQNPRIPRSGCPFDLWNPALQPQNHR